MKPSHKREIGLLIILLVVFSILFLIAIINLQKNAPVFGIGIPYAIEDYVVIILSLLSIGRIFWAIVKH